MEQREEQPPAPIIHGERTPVSLNGQEEEDSRFMVRKEVLPGSWPGGTWMRMVLPRQRPFQRIRTGVLQATPGAQIPQTILEHLKRLVIGKPLANAQTEHERLTRFKALAVLSSDAISSVAYATEAILLSLVAAGSANLGNTLLVSLAIVGLLAIVALSYRQTIPTYPNGGGSYIVAHENLGTLPGLVAAASLMIDYILTVAVSVSAGVQALATLFPALSPAFIVVPIDVALVLIIALINLRGIRESGTIFALPTYLFIVSALLLIALGCIKAFLLQHQPLIGHFSYVAATEPLSLFLILKSFAAGCSAMTGVEAISNGVPAFRKPETRNAAMTLTWMACILGTLFLGLTILALSYHVEANPASNPTVIGQIARLVFTGPWFFLYPVFQFATLLILTLAANTSYADFPRLASLLARDGFLPHQFAFRGDRLAFSSGILFLALLASLLLISFQGKTTQLINLYAVGVFVSFTLSQSGMVHHWWRLRGKQQKWRRSLLLNGLGAVTTFLVALVIATTKFLEGAWIVVLLIPLLVALFLGIHRHYQLVEHSRTLANIPFHPKDIHHRLIVPILDLDLATRYALAYARSISPHVLAVHISTHERQSAQLRKDWEAWQQSVHPSERSDLKVVHATPHGIHSVPSVFLREVANYASKEIITVILPEMVDTPWKRIFSHPMILEWKAFFFFQPHVVVTNISSLRKKPPASRLPSQIRHRIIVPIAALDHATLQSLAYARSMSPHVVAAHVAIDQEDSEALRSQWQQFQEHFATEEHIQLVIIESPYRSLLRPLLTYIDTIQQMYPEETVTVLLPELIVAHWWEQPLHNQTALRLKTALLSRPGIVVTDIPQRIRPDKTQ